jgi:hypothetical protein
MLQLEKLVIRKRYYIVHNWTMSVLELMCIDKSNIGEIFSQWGVKNLHSTNGLENTLVFPYNECSHWSLFILKHHCTLHFDLFLDITIPKMRINL